MNRRIVLILLFVFGVVVFGGLLAHNLLFPHVVNEYEVTVQLSGAEGVPFIGEYIRDGRREKISGVLPWELTDSHVSRVEIRKTRPEDEIRVEMHGGGSMVSTQIRSPVEGVIVRMDGGWSCEGIMEKQKK
ncbi:MAG: hypothetical protein GC154_08720 [bacterium]|nr:hypothetical protein [bacterium]